MELPSNMHVRKEMRWTGSVVYLCFTVVRME